MQENLNHIIVQIQKGDKQAFEKLVDLFQHQVYGLALKILHNEEEARDAVQDCFIRIWKNIHTYNKQKNFKNWTFTILTNIALDKLRVMKRKNLISIDQVQQLDESFERAMDNQEMMKWIQIIANDLPEKQHLVFILRDLQGLDSGQVGEIMGMDGTQVKSNLFHARKSIRKRMNKLLMQEDL